MIKLQKLIFEEETSRNKMSLKDFLKAVRSQTKIGLTIGRYSKRSDGFVADINLPSNIGLSDMSISKVEDSEIEHNPLDQYEFRIDGHLIKINLDEEGLKKIADLLTRLLKQNQTQAISDSEEYLKKLFEEFDKKFSNFQFSESYASGGHRFSFINEELDKPHFGFIAFYPNSGLVKIKISGVEYETYMGRNFEKEYNVYDFNLDQEKLVDQIKSDFFSYISKPH